jgi:hypothetical protein
MNIKSIKNKRFLIGSFKMIKSEFGDEYDINDFESDIYVLETVSGFIQNVLNVKNIEDVDFIYASYILNYKNVDGDFTILDHEDEEILTPKLKKYQAIKTEARSVLFKETYEGEYYLPVIMEHDITEYVIEPIPDPYDGCNIEEIYDTWDTETDIVEIK